MRQLELLSGFQGWRKLLSERSESTPSLQGEFGLFCSGMCEEERSISLQETISKGWYMKKHFTDLIWYHSCRKNVLALFSYTQGTQRRVCISFRSVGSREIRPQSAQSPPTLPELFPYQFPSMPCRWTLSSACFLSFIYSTFFEHLLYQ